MEERKENIMAYLAGILDGDGSFSIIKRTACMNVEKRRIPRYRPCIQMYNLSSDMTQQLQVNLGGNTGIRNSQKENWLPQQYWYCVGLKSCRKALDKIFPFLIVKKEMACLLSNFIDKGLELFQVKNLEDKIIQDREKDYLNMKFLNESRDISPESIKKPSNLPMLETEWAYIAGLMDTDGSFQISRSIKPKRKNYSYELRATIQMLSLKGLNFIYEKTGLGNISLITRGRGSNCRQLFHYRWIITNHSDLKVFLNGVLPYIKYKKEQCLVLLEYIEKSNDFNKLRTDPEILSLKESFYIKIKQLNKYGVLKPSLIDLEAREGDRAEGLGHGERLSEMDSKEYATV